MVMDDKLGVNGGGSAGEVTVFVNFNLLTVKPGNADVVPVNTKRSPAASDGVLKAPFLFIST
jgi:hypothetical protein